MLNCSCSDSSTDSFPGTTSTVTTTDANEYMAAPTAVWCIGNNYIEDKELDFISEERKYLKSLWLESLHQKQRILPRYLARVNYCRRLMVSMSGWIARAGYRRKRN